MDPGSPYATGLTSLWTATVGNAVRLPTGQDLTVTGSAAAWTTGRHGPAVSLPVAGRLTIPDPIPTSGTGSAMVVCLVEGAPTGDGFGWGAGVDTSQRWGMNAPFSDNTAYFDVGSTTVTSGSIAGSPNDNWETWVCCNGPALAGRLYRDGTLLNSGSALTRSTANDAFGFGHNGSESSNGNAGRCCMWATWSRELSVAEAKALSADPYLMFRAW